MSAPTPPRAARPRGARRRWGTSQTDLATLVPDARHTIASRSGHAIFGEQPALVIEAIRQVGAGVRDPATWDDLISCRGS
jgi:hypothetical protein